MKKSLRFTPVFCTALGTAIGFYFLPYLVTGKYSFTPLIIFFIFCIAIAALSFTFIIFCNYASKIDYRFNPDRRLKLLSVCVIVFAAGLVIGLETSVRGQPEWKHFGISQNDVTAIEGVLTEDPRLISSGNAMAEISLLRCASVTPNGYMYATAIGNIIVFFPQDSTVRLREFGRGTTVFLEGSLRASSGENLTFSASSMHIVKPAPGIERLRTGVRLKLIERTQGKDWGGLSIALLLGIKDNLDSDLSAMYRKAGSSYILALSGMHLAVLAAIISFLLKNPLGLKPASVTGAVIIVLYCLLVGPMPSLYRAALMYLLGAVAVIGFLPRQPLSILSLSFLIQIIITPSGGNSISFILSYLALFGIFIIGGPLYELFAGKVPDILMQPLSASCGAFLATAGVTGCVFGYIAPIGIVIGLVLVPLTTLYMVMSIIWLFSGNIMAVPLSLLYKLMESIVGVAAKIPAITTSNSALIIAASVILSILIITLEYKQRQLRLKLMPF